jgi:hypothetical protein
MLSAITLRSSDRPTAMKNRPSRMPAERLDVGFQFVPVGGFGQHHAGDEGAQRHRQAGDLHQHVPDTQNHEKRGRDHRFLGTGSGNHLEQRIEQVTTGNKQCQDGADRDRDIDDRSSRRRRRAPVRSSGTSARIGTIAISWKSRIEKDCCP